MAQITKYENGHFNWIELATKDVDVAKRFYGGLFGWTHEDVPVGPGATYTMFKKGEHTVAAATEMNAEMKAQRVPGHWFSFVAVDDVDAFERKAAECGGKVLRSAFDVMAAGRMAIVAEPTGAQFALWQGKANPGVGLQKEPATLSWTQLMTQNADTSGKFLIQLFGWKPEPKDMAGITHTAFRAGADIVCGMMPITRAMQAAAGDTPIPSHFRPYFEVVNCDASVAQAKTLGGKIMVDPKDIPEVGRYAVVEDPTGAQFGLLQQDPKASASAK